MICQLDRVSLKYSNQQGGGRADDVDTPFARNHGRGGAAIGRGICVKLGGSGSGEKDLPPPTELRANQQW